MVGPAYGTRPAPQSDLPVGGAPAPSVAAVLRGARRRRVSLAVTALGSALQPEQSGLGLPSPSGSDVAKVGVARRYLSSVSGLRHDRTARLAHSRARS
jgi:hypothetical protein